jgi:3-carboxy-cis,cis-muconate cycloisomerase
MSYAIGSGHFMFAFSQEKNVQEIFSVNSDMSAMIDFEKALTIALGRCGLIPSQNVQQIMDVLDKFVPDMDDIQIGFKRDGVAPPSLVHQVRNQLNDECKTSFHYGTTSQDLIDTSLMMRMRDSVAIVSQSLQNLNLKLKELASSHTNEKVLMARTRMQNALPISVPEKIGNWCSQIEVLLASTPQIFLLQLGGPEGAVRKFGASYHDISNDMASTLGLTAAKHVWHTDRQQVTNICFWFTQAATVMGKIAQDVLFMVQSDVGEARIEGGGSSSAMKHKKNPVLAEVILAQARYCHTQMSGINTASIHENERSGTAWTLEWMLVPALLITSANTVVNTNELIENIKIKSVA